MQNSIISLKKQYEVADYNAKPRDALNDTLNYLQNVSKMSSFCCMLIKRISCLLTGTRGINIRRQLE